MSKPFSISQPGRCQRPAGALPTPVGRSSERRGTKTSPDPLLFAAVARFFPMLIKISHQKGLGVSNG
jgi:hypothetical protein